jgi:thiamine-monophosphate kinase
VLWAERIPVSDDARAMSDGRPALEHALGDGEDFELAFAVAAEDGRRLVEEQRVPGITLAAVGECVAERGLWLEEAGQRRELAALGWVHEMD